MSIIYNVPDDGQVFYGKLWNVWLTAIGGPIMVDENTESDAIDAAIDYAESRGWIGYFLDSDAIAELESEGFLDEHYTGGNHCLYLSDTSAPSIERIGRRYRRVRS
jgi:hypothetical protein